MALYNINPANSLATGVASGAQSGGPFVNNAGIYFGSASVGATDQTQTPTLDLSAPTTANSAAPGGVASVGLPAAGFLSGGGSTTEFLIIGALVAGAVLLVVVSRKQKKK